MGWLIWFAIWLVLQILFCVLFVAIDGSWWPFGPRYHVVNGDDSDGDC